MSAKKFLTAAACGIALASSAALAGDTVTAEGLVMTAKWDKTFPQESGVAHSKVAFTNRFGITIAADLYKPENASGHLKTVAVSGPFGAVKEQASGLYAQELAKRGFLTIAFDPSFTGESGGVPRRVASPDINTEDFQAAADYLINRDDVDPEAVGIIGICGFGGLALNALALDTRIKAAVVSTMYDMHRVSANGYFDKQDSEEARHALKKQLNTQRTADFKQGTYARAGGVVDPLPADAPQFVKDYYAYYKTPRGYHARSGNSTDGWNTTSALSFINTPILEYAPEIRQSVLMIHGEKAHSLYFGKTAFEKLTSGKFAANKEFAVIPGASHTDLYDNKAKIPFDRIEQFLHDNLK